MEVTEPPHARLAPSSAHIWAVCAGSVAMQATQPEQEETDESREGTAAHWLLSRTLRKLTTSDDAVAPNGVPINDEMREAIAELVVDVQDTTATCRPGDFWQDEKRVQAHRMIHPDNDGTPDVFFLQYSRKTVHVWDFKYGHRFVDVYQCLQLVNYAAALIDTYEIKDWQDWTFTFTIAQPRCYARDELGGSLREWFTSGTTIAPLIEQLRAAAIAASEPNAPCTTGDHCRDCRAAWDCEANQRAGGVSVDLIHAQQTTGMSPAALGLELKVLAEAEQRVKARREVLEIKAMEIQAQGRNVPWHGIGWSQPRLTWDKPRIPEVASLVAMFGVDVQPGVPLPTPNQCIKQGVDAAVISPYTTKANPSRKLVRVDDTHAAKVFGERTNRN